MSVSVRFDIPASLWMSANQRLGHWSQRHKRTQGLRTLGLAVARRDGIDKLGTTHVAAFIGYPSAGRADPANAGPTVKALIDGMVDAGVWIDDDSDWLIGPTFLREREKAPHGTHTVRLVLTSQAIPWADAEPPDQTTIYDLLTASDSVRGGSDLEGT